MKFSMSNTFNRANSRQLRGGVEYDRVVEGEMFSCVKGETVEASQGDSLCTRWEIKIP